MSPRLQPALGTHRLIVTGAAETPTPAMQTSLPCREVNGDKELVLAGLAGDQGFPRAARLPAVQAEGSGSTQGLAHPAGAGERDPMQEIAKGK